MGVGCAGVTEVFCLPRLAFHRRKIGSSIDAQGNTISILTDRSTGAYKSWKVRPQLENVFLDIVGSRLAAQSYTDIEFSFSPVQNAVTMEATALHPVSF